MRLGELDPNFDLAEARALLAPLLAKLSRREQLIVEMRFFRGCTQAEIGKEIGVSQMHVSRLLSRLVNRMREELHRRRLSRARPSLRPRRGRVGCPITGHPTAMSGSADAREAVAHVVHHLAVLDLRAEHHHLGVLLDPHAVPRRPVEEPRRRAGARRCRRGR